MFTNKIFFTLIVTFIGCTQVSAATVYQNNFESIGSESNGLAASGGLTLLSRFSLPTDGAGLNSSNNSMWLGRLGKDVAKSTSKPETVSLVLNNLVAGSQYHVAFDLLVGGSWDGSATGYGPDRWSLTANSGASSAKLVDATFSNCGVNNQLCGANSPQTYSDTTPLGGVSNTTFHPETGADAYFDTNSDYSKDYGIYWLGHGTGNPLLAFTANATTATLQFQRLQGTTDSSDEYWALDNIVVTGTSAVPIPAAVWFFSAGLLGLTGIARKRKGS